MEPEYSASNVGESLDKALEWTKKQIMESSNRQITAGTITYVYEGEPDPAILGRPIRLVGADCGYCRGNVTGWELPLGAIRIDVCPRCLGQQRREACAAREIDRR